jgi:hypothetical protein
MDWLIILASLLLPVVPLFFFPSCTCCGSSEPCEVTFCDSGTTPDELTVILDGMQNNAGVLGCQDAGLGCTWYNGRSFIVTKIEGQCQWNLSFAGPCSVPPNTNHSLVVQLFQSGTDLKIRVIMSTPAVAGGFQWENTLSATMPFDCSTLTTSATITVNTTSDGCQHDGSTAVSISV